jgi:hypothetical protein
MDVSSPAPTETTTPATTTTPAPAAAAPPMTGAGTFDWKTAGVNDEGLVLVGDRQWKNPGDLVTSYRHLEKLSGVPPERLLKIPTEKDGPDAWKPIFQKLGMPETSDKYVVPVPEGDKGDFAKVARDWFHGANMTQSQVTKVAEQWNAFQAAQAKSQQEALDTRNLSDVTALKSAWGADYDTNSRLVDQAADAFGMDEAILDALKQAAGPKKAMEFLHAIGSKLGVEDTSVPGITSRGTSTAMTPEMAKSEMDRLKQDKTFAQLFTSHDPQQKMDARNTMNRLAQLAYPGTTSVESRRS